jgi:hypothetical protein
MPTGPTTDELRALVRIAAEIEHGLETVVSMLIFRINRDMSTQFDLALGKNTPGWWLPVLLHINKKGGIPITSPRAFVRAMLEEGYIEEAMRCSQILDSIGFSKST